MMRNILYAMIILTSLDGHPVWVESTQVIIIRPARDPKAANAACAEGTGAAIQVGSKGMCVKETPEEIRQKIRDAD